MTRIKSPPSGLPGHDELWRCLRIMFLVAALVLAGDYIAGITWDHGLLRDQHGYVVGRDFLNSWTMGRAGDHDAQPGANYDPAIYAGYLKTFLGAGYIQNWSYPPSYMLLMLPFGVISYTAAWIVFMLIGMGLLVHLLRRSSARDIVALVLASPAMWFCVWAGQIGMLAASVQLAALKLLESRPVMAGVLLGLLSVKPQIALAYPFFLIATRRWRTLAAAALTGIGLALVAAMVIGVDSWRIYIHTALPVQQMILRDPPFAWLSTVYADMRLLAVPFAGAIAGQCLVGVAVMLSFFTRTFRRMEKEGQWVAIAAANVLATPYFMIYDLVFLTCAVAIYWRTRPALTNGEKTILTASLLLPAVHYIMGLLGIPGSILIPALLILTIFRRARAVAGVVV